MHNEEPNHEVWRQCCESSKIINNNYIL